MAKTILFHIYQPQVFKKTCGFLVRFKSGPADQSDRSGAVKRGRERPGCAGAVSPVGKQLWIVNKVFNSTHSRLILTPIWTLFFIPGNFLLFCTGFFLMKIIKVLDVAVFNLQNSKLPSLSIIIYWNKNCSFCRQMKTWLQVWSHDHPHSCQWHWLVNEKLGSTQSCWACLNPHLHPSRQDCNRFDI